MPDLTLRRPPVHQFGCREISLTNAANGTVGSPQDVQFTSLGRPVNPSTTPNAGTTYASPLPEPTPLQRGTAQAINLKTASDRTIGLPWDTGSFLVLCKFVRPVVGLGGAPLGGAPPV